MALIIGKVADSWATPFKIKRFMSGSPRPKYRQRTPTKVPLTNTTLHQNSRSIGSLKIATFSSNITKQTGGHTLLSRVAKIGVAGAANEVPHKT